MKFKRWLPLLAWMALIFYLSGRTENEIPSFGFWDLLAKKGAHFLAYSFLSLLAWRGAMGEKRPLPPHKTKPFLTAFVITLLYAISDEFHQSFIPTRHGQPLDVLIDTVGGLTMLLLLYYWSGWKTRKSATG